MANTLERLRALNLKLDEKLREMRDDENGHTDKKDLSETDENDFVVEGDSDLDESQRVERLSKILIDNLGFDPNREPVRNRNIKRMTELYLRLDIAKKIEEYGKIMIYKAMNISGIGLKEEDFGEIREGKYVQIIAITYEPDKNGKKKAKNISLAYFGKAESLEEKRKNEVIEFVLRWRYEKAFQNLEHYKHLIGRLKPMNRLF
jgi:hypothetical protein